MRATRAEPAGLLRIVSASLLVFFAALSCLSADSAAHWLDRAADPTRSLREREYAARRVIMLADDAASIIISALRGEGSDSGLRRQVAATILGELDLPEAEGLLIEAAFGKDYFLAEAASAALGRIYSRRGEGELYTLLKKGHPTGLSLPGDAAGGDDWIALSMRTAETRGRFRSLVMRGLALKYSEPGAVVPGPLADCVWDGLNDADPQLRLHSLAAAVRTSGGLASEKVAAFLYLENNPKLLAAALRAMAEMRPPDYGEAVERHVAHADPAVALEALAALDAMGYAGCMFPAAPGGRAVATFASHPSTPVRRRAIELLAASKNPAALEYLQAALFDRVAANRAAAARALGELGFTGAVGTLNPLLGDGRPEVRAEAAVSLSRLGVVGVVTRMIGDVEGESPPFRRAAAEALGRIGDASALPALLAALDDGDAELVCLAAEALGRLKDPKAGERLFALLGATDEPVVADAARKALHAIYDDDPGDTPASWKLWAWRNDF